MLLGDLQRWSNTENKFNCKNDFQQEWLDINLTVECKKIHLSMQMADFWWKKQVKYSKFHLNVTVKLWFGKRILIQMLDLIWFIFVQNIFKQASIYGNSGSKGGVWWVGVYLNRLCRCNTQIRINWEQFIMIYTLNLKWFILIMRKSYSLIS